MTQRYNPLSEKKKIRATVVQSRQMFNKYLFDLINIACTKNAADDQIQSIKEVFVTIKAAEPTVIITNAGPYIWKYRDQIAKKDARFFIENNFENDVAEFYNDPVPEMQDTFSQDEVGAILQSLKRTWHLLNKSEKEVIWRHTTNLLKTYAQYLGSQKKIIKINKEIQDMTAR